VKKYKYKKIIISIIITAVLGVSEFIGILPYAVVRITSSIYVAINYPKNGFKFKNEEYAYAFGDYIVRFSDKEGKGIGIMLTPKVFPCVIIWDSIKQDGFDD
jgi:hypothetical protein